jgi:hypothetical protein
MIIQILIVIAGGVFAGIATGLVGLSAAAIIVPLLTTLLGVDAYTAVGIALASDVIASLLSAKTYHKNGNLDIVRGKYLLVSVLIFTLIASYVSFLMDNSNVGGAMNLFAIFLGFRFYFKKVNTKELKNETKNHILLTIVMGTLVGIICGYVGAGGGLMLLMVLTRVLGYSTKMAVGTSVFIMGFTALTGAVSHIALGGTNILYLLISVTSATVGALFASNYANRVSEEKSNKVVGICLMVFGLVLSLIKIL